MPIDPIRRPQPGPVTGTGRLRAGAAHVDFTPWLGLGTCGYSLYAPRAQGVWGRLGATVLVLEDGDGERVALIGADLHGGSRWLSEAVAARVAAETGLTVDRIWLAATHTHLGPAGLYGNATYDRVTADPLDQRSFDEEVATYVANALALGVTTAVSRLTEARVGIGSAHAWGCVWNRSTGATWVERLPSDSDHGRDPDEVERSAIPWSQARAEELARTLNGVDAGGLVDWWEQASEDLRAMPLWAPPPAPRRAGPPPDEVAAFRHLLPPDSSAAPELPHHEFLAALARLPDRPKPRGRAAPSDPLERAIGDRWLADARVRVVWAETPSGEPIGGVAALSATPTILGYQFALFTPDLYGEASHVVQAAFGTGAAPSVADAATLEQSRAGRVPFGYAGGAVGDANAVSPRRTVDELVAARHDVDAIVEVAREAGQAVGRATIQAIEAARADLWSDLSLQVAFDEPVLAGASYTDRFGTRELADKARLGAATARGGDLGPGVKDLFHEGNPTAFRPRDPQSPKRWWPFGGLPDANPAPPIRVLTLKQGEQVRGALIAAPAEVSVAMANRLARIFDDNGEIPVVTMSPAGEYLSYVGTEWEYRAQHYEGAGVPFGRWTGGWLHHHVRRLRNMGPQVPTGQVVFSGEPRRREPKLPTGRDELPVPSHRLDRWASDPAPVGIAVTRTADWVEIGGWWTPGTDALELPPLAAHAWVVIERRGEQGFVPVVDQGARVDDRNFATLLVRVPRKEGARYAFVLRVTKPGDWASSGAELRFRVLGPEAIRPSAPPPSATVPESAPPAAPAGRALAAPEDEVDLAAATGIRRIVGGEPTREFLSCCCVGKLKYGRVDWCCTGVLVAPRVVLTAAHCRTITHAYVGGYEVDPLDGSGEVHEVLHHRVHPDYDSQRLRHDIALLVLSRSSRITPARIARPEELARAQSVQLVGFGCDDARATSGFGTKRTVQVNLGARRVRPDEDLAEDEARYGFFSDAEFVAGRKSLAKDTCKGDSGGPAYLSSGAVAGLTSRPTAEYDPAKPCGDGGIYVRIDAYRDWIDATLTELGLGPLV